MEAKPDTLAFMNPSVSYMFNPLVNSRHLCLPTELRPGLVNPARTHEVVAVIDALADFLGMPGEFRPIVRARASHAAFGQAAGAQITVPECRPKTSGDADFRPKLLESLVNKRPARVIVDDQRAGAARGGFPGGESFHYHRTELQVNPNPLAGRALGLARRESENHRFVDICPRRPEPFPISCKHAGWSSIG